jgi:hypothetical protein
MKKFGFCMVLIVFLLQVTSAQNPLRELVNTGTFEASSFPSQSSIVKLELFVVSPGANARLIGVITAFDVLKDSQNHSTIRQTNGVFTGPIAQPGSKSLISFPEKNVSLLKVPESIRLIGTGSVNLIYKQGPELVLNRKESIKTIDADIEALFQNVEKSNLEKMSSQISGLNTTNKNLESQITALGDRQKEAELKNEKNVLFLIQNAEKTVKDAKDQKIKHVKIMDTFIALLSPAREAAIAKVKENQKKFINQIKKWEKSLSSSNLTCSELNKIYGLAEAMSNEIMKAIQPAANKVFNIAMSARFNLDLLNSKQTEIISMIKSLPPDKQTQPQLSISAFQTMSPDPDIQKIETEFKPDGSYFMNATAPVIGLLNTITEKKSSCK